jgi:hypothetical protein
MKVAVFWCQYFSFVKKKMFSGRIMCEDIIIFCIFARIYLLKYV